MSAISGLVAGGQSAIFTLLRRNSALFTRTLRACGCCRTGVGRGRGQRRKNMDGRGEIM